MLKHRNPSVLGIMPASRFSALSLSLKTCPLGILSLLSRDADIDGLVFNEEVSGNCFSVIPYAIKNAKTILLSAHCGNIQQSLYLGQQLAADGKFVWIGGPEPSMIGPRLLKDHPYLSGLVVGAGDSISHFLFSRHGNVPKNVFLTGLHNFDSPNYSCPPTLLDFQDMKIDYTRLYDLDRHDGVSYLWGNDCSQAKKRCFFCGRLSLGVGYRPATKVWDELFYVYHRGIRLFYNTTDSVTTNISEFRRFCEAKPTEMCSDVHRVFVNSNRVNKELICALKRLNGVAVIGVESFGRMKVTGKAHTSVQDNLDAIKMLAENEIRMVLSFVIGLPGETHETLAETKQGIINLVENYGHLLDSIHLSPLLVTTGSPAWHKLMALQEVQSKYTVKKVPFDVIEVTNDYFRFFCGVSREFCIEQIFGLCEVIRSIAPWIRVGAKGILKSEETEIEEQAYTLEPKQLQKSAERHVRQNSVVVKTAVVIDNSVMFKNT